MRSIYIFAYVLFLLSRLARAEVFGTCENITLHWKLISFSQGNLLVNKEPETQNRTGTFNLMCDNAHVNNPAISNVIVRPHVETSVNFRIEQVDIYSEQNKCYLQYCLISYSHEQCRNYQSCNFTLPVISLAPSNSSERSILLQWAPINEQTGDLIISNYKTHNQYQYEVFCDGFDVTNYTFILETSSVDGAPELLKVTLTVNENSAVEQYQCLVQLCITREQQNTCTNTSYYHMDIPDVINGRIVQKSNVFYYHWNKPSSAVELQVTGDQPNCDGVKFHRLTDHMHDNQGQLIVNYISSAMTVRGKGNFTVNCSTTTSVISDVLIQQYIEATLIFPLDYFNNTFCSMNICLIANNSCIEATKCDVRPHGVVDDNTKIINNRASESFAITYCHQLKFQWMPKGLDHGNLIVTKELEIEHENQLGNFSLTCENSEVENTITPLIPLYPLSANNKLTLDFLLRHIDIDREQNECSLKIYISKQHHSSYKHSLQCNITIPAFKISSNYEPVLFQWIPMGDDKGDLMMFIKKKDKEYQYEVLCDGFVVENYTFGLEKYHLKVSLLLNKSIIVEQYQCVVQMCVNSSEHLCSTYKIIVPDIDVTNKRILRRPNLFYYHWEKPYGAVELPKILSCELVKLYVLRRNATQGELILSFSSSVMVTRMFNFKLKCGGGTIIQPSITDVLVQPYVDVTMKFLVENSPNNSLCLLKICYNKMSSEACLFHCRFRWFIPEARYLSSNDNTAVPMSFTEDDNITQPTAVPMSFTEDDNITQPTAVPMSFTEDDNITQPTAVPMSFLGDDSITEPCTPNTWLWVVDTSEEGRLHFIVGNNIINNDRYDGKISLSCANLTVANLNPQPLQTALTNGYVASFIVRNTGDINTARYQECVYGACLAGSDNECKLIEKCYITIALRQGTFEWSGQSNLAETCPESVWEWEASSTGGSLSITYKTKKKERGTIGIQCTGIEVNGKNEIVNTDVATFTLVNISNNVSPPPYCNVRVCVRQDEFIGCKKSLNCAVTIPSNDVPRAARSYEEPSEELLENCEQENSESDSPIPPCSDEMSDVFYNNGYAEGEVSLRIKLQGNDKIDEFLKVSVYCSGLDLKGSTEYKLVIPKMQKETTVEFNISLPKSINEEPQTHQCTVQTQRRPKSHTEQANNTMCPSTTSCSISVKTALGRILPKCNATEGRRSIHQLDVKYDQARVEITVFSSPNNVYTVDPYCNENNPFGHNTTEELLTNTFPSTTTGEGKVTIAISFYPECDNKTIASHFENKRLEDCHMDVYWYCQGGEQVIESIKNLQFADEPMYCEPQSIAKRLIKSLQKTFGVYSEPIAILLAILIGVASLYVLLIPACCIAVYWQCKKYGLVPGTRVQCKHIGDIDSTDSLTLDKEIITINDDAPSLIPAPPPPPPLLSAPQSSVATPPHSLLLTSKPAPPPPPRSPPILPSLIPAPPPPPRSPPILPSLIPAPPPPPRSPPQLSSVTATPPKSLSLLGPAPPPPPRTPLPSSAPGKSLGAAPPPPPRSSVPVPPPPLPSVSTPITPRQRESVNAKNLIPPPTKLLHQQSPAPPPVPKKPDIQKSPTAPRESLATPLLPPPLIPSLLIQDDGSQPATSSVVTSPPP